ncbi:MAG: DNA polymerase II large subunit, partial [Candidatus Nanoarchaeia archaeon]|nr:DNA polymerase II large subunit [Candidatus Nanoarchaeia archaeon]
YKDLPRVETNSIRGGMCLVIGEGLCLKAKKLFKNLKKWGKDFGMEHWEFLDGFLKLQTEIHSKSSSGETKENEDIKIKPNYRYLEATVGGRPVLSYPLEAGGFRIRYGRSRLTGLAGDAIHPATMVILNGFIATGTQIAGERPGKATIATPCDSIEGPVVKLKNGDIMCVNDVDLAKKIKDDVKEIIFLGDILTNYGDFAQNGHKLVPSGYVEEWWVQELEKTEAKNHFPSEFFSHKTHSYFYKIPTPKDAIAISEKYNIPLHPKYTYHWHDITKNNIVCLTEWLSKANIISNQKIIAEMSEAKRYLELLCVPHKVINNMVVVEEHTHTLLYTLGYFKNNLFDIEKIKQTSKDAIDSMDMINKLSPVKIREKAPVYLGCRMGRPEKAKMRIMKGSPHCLFPCGEEGGRYRSYNDAMQKEKITSSFPFFECEKCGNITALSLCEKCGNICKLVKKCTKCGIYTEEEMHCGEKTKEYETREIPINEYIHSSLSYIQENMPELVKGVKGMSNKTKVSEHIIKGILRAKHDVYVNKDGTIRFDMTEAPITHFYPREIGTNIEKLREMGYEKDIYGNDLNDENQVVELFPQDIIMPQCEEWEEACSVTSLIKVCNFIDDLLVKFYKQEPFYNIKSKEELVGHLVICLAPHTSAGMLGRIIGFSNTQCFFAHPYMHCATRRNCDGDEDGIIMLMDAFLNFSRDFLPNKRGSKTMDAPLVLTTGIIPMEIDDEVYAMDIVDHYPLEFYEATQEYKYPWDIPIEQVKDRLGKPSQYFGFKYTHPSLSMNAGVRVSSYKSLKTMQEKIDTQMNLAEKIRAVKEGDMAGLIINNHFLRDIKGNLRKFSRQTFRCVHCNEKYRRVPVLGRCTKCKTGKIIFTVSEGFVSKYMNSCMELSNKYNLSNYLKQTLEILKRRMDALFGWETEKQTGLSEFIGAKISKKE